jgi:hypothetical protein
MTATRVTAVEVIRDAIDAAAGTPGFPAARVRGGEVGFPLVAEIVERIASHDDCGLTERQALAQEWQSFAHFAMETCLRLAAQDGRDALQAELKGLLMLLNYTADYQGAADG